MSTIPTPPKTLNQISIAQAHLTETVIFTVIFSYNEIFLQWNFLTMKFFYNGIFLQWNLLTMKCSYNEIFLQWNFLTMKFFYSEIFLQWNFLTMKIPYKKLIVKLISLLKNIIVQNIRFHAFTNFNKKISL